MRTLIMASVLSVMGVAAPTARSAVPIPAAPPVAPATPLGPPRAFQGYSQPEISAAYCRVVNPGQTTCTLPAMTAGRYLIKAAGVSTAQGAGAAQQLTILVGNRACGPATRKPTPTSPPWTSGPKTIRLNCEVLILTDRPLAVTAIYADTKATKAPAGPTLTLERLPWEGVLDITAAPTPQDP